MAQLVRDNTGIFRVSAQKKLSGHNEKRPMQDKLHGALDRGSGYRLISGLMVSQLSDFLHDVLDLHESMVSKTDSQRVGQPGKRPVIQAFMPKPGLFVMDHRSLCHSQVIQSPLVKSAAAITHLNIGRARTCSDSGRLQSKILQIQNHQTRFNLAPKDLVIKSCWIPCFRSRKAIHRTSNP